MQIFKINEHLEAVCEWKKTRIAFKHEATLMLNGIDRVKVKICYQNRTWERYTYESVLQKLLGASEKLLSSDELAQFKKTIENGGEREMAGLRNVGVIATLGEVFGKTPKEANDWKARMLQAGLGEGIEMPSDWDSLDEATKTARLDACINQLTKAK
jgi:hypothetical protein